MSSQYLVPTPGQSIAISLASLSQLQRQASALLWVNGSTGQAPLQLMRSVDRKTAYLSPPPGSVAWILIRELGIDLADAQALNQTGFPGVLAPLKACSFGAKLLILSIALYLFSPDHPVDLKPGQGAVVALWAAELEISPADIEPYLRLHGELLHRFMVGKQMREN